MDHSTHTTHLLPVAAMAWSGFTLTVLVPGTVLVTRWARLWQRVSVPPGVALSLFVALHAWAVLGGMLHLPPDPGPLVTEPALLTGAALFWVPVVARTRHRLSDASRCLYLFLAAPLLDLPAVGVIATGHSAEGLAMIVGMLPLGIAAAAVTWSWAMREERLARRAESAPAPQPHGGAHAR